MIYKEIYFSWASHVVLVVKNPPAKAGDLREAGSIPGLGRSPGGGHSSPLHYSCLEDPMDRGACWAAAHRVSKSQTRLKHLSAHTHTFKTMKRYQFKPTMAFGPPSLPRWFQIPLLSWVQ